jgi:hypothetical protein
MRDDQSRLHERPTPTISMHSNRIKNSLGQQHGRESASANSPERDAVAPGQAASTQQIYNAAWSMAKRDWELNRLFNAWYYEI